MYVLSFYFSILKQMKFKCHQSENISIKLENNNFMSDIRYKIYCTRITQTFVEKDYFHNIIMTKNRQIRNQGRKQKRHGCFRLVVAKGIGGRRKRVENYCEEETL